MGLICPISPELAVCLQLRYAGGHETLTISPLKEVRPVLPVSGLLLIQTTGFVRLDQEQQLSSWLANVHWPFAGNHGS
jgi:hypothetical protein